MPNQSTRVMSKLLRSADDPDQRPGQQHGGGQKAGQQSQSPAKDDKNPKEPYDQTSDTDTLKSRPLRRVSLNHNEGRADDRRVRQTMKPRLATSFRSMSTIAKVGCNRRMSFDHSLRPMALIRRP